MRRFGRSLPRAFGRNRFPAGGSRARAQLTSPSTAYASKSHRHGPPDRNAATPIPSRARDLSISWGGARGGSRYKPEGCSSRSFCFGQIPFGRIVEPELARRPPCPTGLGRAMVAGRGVPSAGIWRGDFPTMRGEGEATWNNGPGASSLSPSARKSGRQITAGTPRPAQPSTQPEGVPKRRDAPSDSPP